MIWYRYTIEKKFKSWVSEETTVINKTTGEPGQGHIEGTKINIRNKNLILLHITNNNLKVFEAYKLLEKHNL